MDVKSFDSPIGNITNIASNLYAMLPQFDKDSREYKTLEQRIRIMRRFQGDAIDKAKGITSRGMPRSWSHRQSYIPIPESATPEQIEEITKRNKEIQFQNSICCNKKAYFFGYVYPKKMEEYKAHKRIYDRNCRIMFGMDVNDLIKIVDKSPEQKKFLRDYYRYSPLFNSKCPMNILAKYIEDIDFRYRFSKRKNSFDYTALMSCSVDDIDVVVARRVQRMAKKYSRLH